MTDSRKKTGKGAAAGGKEGRQARLAKALRDNVKRRRARARSLADGATPPSKSPSSDK